MISRTGTTATGEVPTLLVVELLLELFPFEAFADCELLFVLAFSARLKL